MSQIYGKDFANAYNTNWSFFGPKMWPFLAEAVARRNPEASTWLDLCCGTGSLLELVCENGFQATGVDASKHQLEHARQNAPRALLLHDDIRDLSLPDSFDVITCMFDSLNYLTAKKDILRVFRRVRRHLAAGGIFAFDINTYEGLQDQWCQTTTTEDPAMVLIVETSFDAKRALGHCLITGFVQEGARYRGFKEEHIERGYHAEEIEGLLEQAGFSFRKYDGYSLGRPRKRSGRLLYACTAR